MGNPMTSEFPKDFSAPVLALIALGEKAAGGMQWPDYTELGITSEHIPELIRIHNSVEEFWPEGETDAPEVYAPIHAWRALGQLQAEQAIPDLIELIVWNEEGEVHWVMEEVPEVMGMIGPACIPPLHDYLLDPDKKVWASVTVGHCLAEVGKQHPERRAECVNALQAGLEQFATNDETINSYLVSYLSELKAVEATPLVERVFQAGVVDLSVMGDFEEYQISVGLLEKRLTPPPRYAMAPDPEAKWEADKESRRKEEQRQREQAKKEKKKKKQAKKARKMKKGKRK
jgi:hypothetical protein